MSLIESCFLQKKNYFFLFLFLLIFELAELARYSRSGLSRFELRVKKRNDQCPSCALALVNRPHFHSHLSIYRLRGSIRGREASKSFIFSLSAADSFSEPSQSSAAAASSSSAVACSMPRFASAVAKSQKSSCVWPTQPTSSAALKRSMLRCQRPWRKATTAL
jgi:hypothetical protein